MRRGGTTIFMAHTRRRHLLLPLAALALLLAAPGSAGARPSSVGLTMPKRLAQGDLVAITAVARPARPSVCTLAVRYADGQLQPNLPPAGGSNGRVRWRFRVMGNAAPGRATVTASCRGAGVAQRSALVVGSVIPARIVVVKTGFSVRNFPFGSGVASYGVILKNASPSEDALNVYTLVNFVGPDNHLVGSAGTTLQGIPANQQFAVGGDLTFPGSVPSISRLEVVVQIQSRESHSLRLPTISNLYIEPSIIDPTYVGAVDGEVANDETNLVLQNTQLSAVVFDAGGNILGGGTGFSFGTLPPSAREFFKIQGGFSAVPMNRAASAMVSAVGNYQHR
ncbi:MAG: hypothetical protein JF623_06265 [Acidobacteria bacterium]|nr:hypothetical protein [Acidobacteriota bacterium]